MRPVIIASCLALAAASVFSAFNTNATRDFDDSCWSETFVENFDELSLWDSSDNPGIWKTSYIWGSDIRINEELQYYVDPLTHTVNPFSIDKGILKISATKTPAALLPTVNNMPYISGTLTTEKNFSQKYGRFEARLKVPAGKGLWSAFWLLPSFDSWPEGIAVLPEIDVMEYLGHEKHTYHTTLHTNQNGKLESHSYEHAAPDVLSENFHLYSVIWNEQRISWYLDGKQVAEHRTPEDYVRPVHFLLNLAVGGVWPGSPDAQTVFPASYEVDYVKAFKKSANCL